MLRQFNGEWKIFSTNDTITIGSIYARNKNEHDTRTLPYTIYKNKFEMDFEQNPNPVQLLTTLK